MTSGAAYSQRVVAAFNASFTTCTAMGNSLNYITRCSDPKAFSLACFSHNEVGAAVIRSIDPTSGAVTGNDGAAIAMNGSFFPVVSIAGSVPVPMFSPNEYSTYVVSGHNALWVYAISRSSYLPQPTQFQLLCGNPSLMDGKALDGTCDVATFGKLISFAPNVGDYSSPDLYTNFRCDFYVVDGFSVRCVSFSYNTTGLVSTLVAQVFKPYYAKPLSFIALGGSYKMECSSSTYYAAVNRPSYIFGYIYSTDHYDEFGKLISIGGSNMAQLFNTLSTSNDNGYILGIAVDPSGNVFFASSSYIGDSNPTLADIMVFDTSGVITKIASSLRCDSSGSSYVDAILSICPMTVNPLTGEVFVSTLDGIIGLLNPSSSPSSASLTPLNIALISSTAFLFCACSALTVLLYLRHTNKAPSNSDLEMSGMISEPINSYALMSS